MMLIPSFVLFYLIVTNKSQIDRLFTKEMLERLKVDNHSLGKVGRNVFLFLALFSFIVALSRPVLPDKEREIEQRGATLFVLFDISASMGVKEFYPNRFEFAKQKFYTLIERAEQYEIGIGAYANDFFLVSPITVDRDILRYFIENLNFSSISNRGTTVMSALEGANRILKDQKEKYLLLFSDGGDEQDFTQAINYAKSHNMRIFINAIAKREGAAIETQEGLQKDQAGNIVISKLNSKIKELALQSGGAYIEATSSTEDIRLLFDELNKSVTFHEHKKKEIKSYTELFYYPLGMGVLCLMVAFTSLPRGKFRKDQKV
jgi:Ca-activated chloride channel family protein